MNEKLQEFIASLGVMSEMWLIVYNQFLEKVKNEQVAINHTKAFMDVLFVSILGKK